MKKDEAPDMALKAFSDYEGFKKHISLNKEIYVRIQSGQKVDVYGCDAEEFYLTYPSTVCEEYIKALKQELKNIKSSIKNAEEQTEKTIELLTVYRKHISHKGYNLLAIDVALGKIKAKQEIEKISRTILPARNEEKREGQPFRIGAHMAAPINEEVEGQQREGQPNNVDVAHRNEFKEAIEFKEVIERPASPKNQNEIRERRANFFDKILSSQKSNGNNNTSGVSPTIAVGLPPEENNTTNPCCTIS